MTESRGSPNAPEAAAAPAAPAGAYAFVESLHLRQWCQRLVAPLAVLATNGGPSSAEAWFDLPRLPRFDAPLASIPAVPPGAVAGVSTAILASGIGAVAVAAWLRVAAKGVLVRKTTVTGSGVYSMVRHPYYLANIAGCAGVLAAASPLGAVAGLAWLAVAIPVFVVTIAGEERGLAAIHGATWREYAARVPRLVPAGLRGLGAAVATPVSWRNLCAENEPPRLMRFLAVLCAVLAARLGRSDGAALAAAAGLLWVSSFAVQRLIRTPRRSR